MADLTIDQVREKFPQYKDLSDEQLAQGLHKKYYADMPFDQFSEKIGYKKSRPQGMPGRVSGFSATPEEMPSQGAIDPYSGQFIPGVSQADVNRMLSESGKGVISGVAQTATGLGELLPGEAGKASARATQALRGYGYGPSQVLGSALVPVASAAKAPVLAGALYGAAAPTGEEDPLKRYGEKAISSVLGAVPGAVGKLIGYGSEIARRIGGKEALKGAEEIRTAVRGLTQEEIAAQQEVAAQAQRKLSSIEAAQNQIAQREAVAEQRAAAQAGAPVQSMEDLKAAALAKARERVADAVNDARKAGLTEAETVAHVANVEGQVSKAENAIKEIEQRIASGEQISPEEFGSMIRDTAQKIRDEGVANREKLAGFGNAISSAGNQPIVDTSRVISKINKILKSERDPSIINTLSVIKNMMTTRVRNKDINALSVASTDSLRKFMDRVQATKMIQMEGGKAGDAAAAVHHVSELKDMLLNSAKKAHKPYSEALAKFRELSRPLDIVSRKGALKTALDVDSLSQEFLRGSAEVAGRVIQRAREGQPVFTRLLAENPEIKNGARAYFNRELFGGGRVPTIDSLRAWTQKNEGVLRQLGLLDEYKTIASARAAGQKALDTVKAELTQAKAAQKAATATAREAERAIAGRERLRGLAVSRAEAVKPVTPEQIAKKSAARAEKAESRLAKAAIEPTKALATAEARQDALNKSMTELEAAKPSDIANKAKSIISDLRDKRIIDDTQYDDLLRKIEMTNSAFGKTEKAKSVLVKTLLVGVPTGALTYAGEEIIRKKLGGQ